MADQAPSFLAGWANFYVMIGSSAAALTGLMFVVITLVSGDERPGSSDGINTFSTPTVLHFCAAFITAAALSAPWHKMLFPGIVIGLVGFAGVLYTMRIMYRAATRLRTYTPDLEDWCFFWICPFLGYGAILGAGIAMPHAPATALFAVAGGVVLLIFVGIRNAWDVVTYLAVTLAEEKAEKK
jgi:hypothetical protein